MSMSDDLNFSNLSLNSTSAQQEDWDRSLVLEPDSFTSVTTPRNSVAFPADTGATPGRTRADTIEAPGSTSGKGKRTLSELLRLHAEKGTDVNFSQEEASRVADVLGQWINASSSPYEGEDDFFTRAHDDSSIPSKKSPSIDARPRGQSESANSRPPSSTGFVQS